MNQRGTIILLLVAVLMAVVLLLRRSGVLSVGEEAEETPPAVQNVFDVATGDEVVAFSFTDNESGDVLAAEAEEGEEGQSWTLTEAPTEPEEGQVTDQPRLSAAARAMVALVSSRELSQLESLTEYGLEEARYTLEFTTDSGDQFTLYIGEKTPAGNHYYTQPRGEELVHLVSAATIDTFIRLLEEPPYAEPTPTPEPTPTLEPTPES